MAKQITVQMKQQKHTVFIDETPVAIIHLSSLDEQVPFTSELTDVVVNGINETFKTQNPKFAKNISNARFNQLLNFVDSKATVEDFFDLIEFQQIAAEYSNGIDAVAGVKKTFLHPEREIIVVIQKNSNQSIQKFTVLINCNSPKKQVKIELFRNNKFNVDFTSTLLMLRFGGLKQMMQILDKLEPEQVQKQQEPKTERHPCQCCQRQKQVFTDPSTHAVPPMPMSPHEMMELFKAIEEQVQKKHEPKTESHQSQHCHRNQKPVWTHTIPPKQMPCSPHELHELFKLLGLLKPF